MRAVGFDGELVLTGGVGLPNKTKRQSNSDRVFSGRFLYVGRLSSEKNITVLLRVFSLPSMQNYQLSVVGNGPEFEALKLVASNNVKFISHIKNEKIHEIYESHDVFILPSISEPWGLVVEEALFYGLPVLASTQVGSVEDLVIESGAGLAFDPFSVGSLKSVIELMVQNYEKYAAAVRSINFRIRDENQIHAYVNAVKSGETE
jgi:glycosyltransferase involved in cell wall biosynthesis